MRLFILISCFVLGIVFKTQAQVIDPMKPPSIIYVLEKPSEATLMKPQQHSISNAGKYKIIQANAEMLNSLVQQAKQVNRLGKQPYMVVKSMQEAIEVNEGKKAFEGYVVVE
jgi:hypothetical protein